MHIGAKFSLVLKGIQSIGGGRPHLP